MTKTPITSSAFAALPTRHQLRRVEQLARQALPLFGVPTDSAIKLLNYSENATYLITPPIGPRRVLRINRPGYHPRSHIASELAWVHALKRDTAIVTAEPLAGLDGEFVQHVWHPAVPEPRHCVLMTFVEGTEPDDANRLASFELLGEVTAQLHLHAASWTPPRPILRERWDFDAMLGDRPLWGDWAKGLGMTPAKKRHLARLLPVLRRRVDAVGYSRARFGLVHADLRAANLLVHQDRVAVIDFDDCGHSWFIYDLAAALSFIETHPDVPAYIDAWLGGYTQKRRLSKVELAEIPTFIMLRRMLLVAWIGSHADTAQAQAMGPRFTDDTCNLADDYLGHFN
ncbi:MAG: aminoglycoside phosphotransferase [Rariglobus sp.]|nr:aminoglycoside phosphotransferase [Rariglobus sp.]